MRGGGGSVKRPRGAGAATALTPGAWLLLPFYLARCCVLELVPSLLLALGRCLPLALTLLLSLAMNMLEHLPGGGGAYASLINPFKRFFHFGGSRNGANGQKLLYPYSDESGCGDLDPDATDENGNPVFLRGGGIGPGGGFHVDQTGASTSASALASSELDKRKRRKNKRSNRDDGRTQKAEDIPGNRGDADLNDLLSFLGENADSSKKKKAKTSSNSNHSGAAGGATTVQAAVLPQQQQAPAPVEVKQAPAGSQTNSGAAATAATGATGGGKKKKANKVPNGNIPSAKMEEIDNGNAAAASLPITANEETKTVSDKKSNESKRKKQDSNGKNDKVPKTNGDKTSKNNNETVVPEKTTKTTANGIVNMDKKKVENNVQNGKSKKDKTPGNASKSESSKAANSDTKGAKNGSTLTVNLPPKVAASPAPILDPNGDPILDHNGAPVLDPNGAPILDPNGASILDPNGVHPENFIFTDYDHLPKAEQAFQEVTNRGKKNKKKTTTPTGGNQRLTNGRDYMVNSWTQQKANSIEGGGGYTGAGRGRGPLPRSITPPPASSLGGGGNGGSSSASSECGSRASEPAVAIGPRPGSATAVGRAFSPSAFPCLDGAGKQRAFSPSGFPSLTAAKCRARRNSTGNADQPIQPTVEQDNSDVESVKSDSKLNCGPAPISYARIAAKGGQREEEDEDFDIGERQFSDGDINEQFPAMPQSQSTDSPVADTGKSNSVSTEAPKSDTASCASASVNESPVESVGKSDKIMATPNPSLDLPASSETVFSDVKRLVKPSKSKPIPVPNKHVPQTKSAKSNGELSHGSKANKVVKAVKQAEPPQFVKPPAEQAPTKIVEKLAAMEQATMQVVESRPEKLPLKPAEPVKPPAEAAPKSSPPLPKVSSANSLTARAVAGANGTTKPKSKGVEFIGLTDQEPVDFSFVFDANLPQLPMSVTIEVKNPQIVPPTTTPNPANPNPKLAAVQAGALNGMVNNAAGLTFLQDPATQLPVSGPPPPPQPQQPVSAPPLQQQQQLPPATYMMQHPQAEGPQPHPAAGPMPHFYPGPVGPIPYQSAPYHWHVAHHHHVIPAQFTQPPPPLPPRAPSHDSTPPPMVDLRLVAPLPPPRPPVAPVKEDSPPVAPQQPPVQQNQPQQQPLPQQQQPPQQQQQPEAQQVQITLEDHKSFPPLPTKRQTPSPPQQPASKDPSPVPQPRRPSTSKEPSRPTKQPTPPPPSKHAAAPVVATKRAARSKEASPVPPAPQRQRESPAPPAEGLGRKSTLQRSIPPREHDPNYQVGNFDLRGAVNFLSADYDFVARLAVKNPKIYYNGDVPQT